MQQTLFFGYNNSFTLMWDIYLSEMYMYMSILHSSFIPTSVESFNMLNCYFFFKKKKKHWSECYHPYGVCACQIFKVFHARFYIKYFTYTDSLWRKLCTISQCFLQIRMKPPPPKKTQKTNPKTTNNKEEEEEEENAFYCLGKTKYTYI